MLGQQPPSGPGDELVKLKLQFADFAVEHAMTAGEAVQHPLVVLSGSRPDAARSATDSFGLQRDELVAQLIGGADDQRP